MARGISSLVPWLRGPAADLVAAAREAGWDLVVVSAYRTEAEQRRLKPGPGLPKATNSLHVQRRAFDLGVRGVPYRQVDPQLWQDLGDLWEQAGGRWGGRFGDPVHFDA